MAVWHALYEIAGAYFWRPFHADDFAHAVEQATDATVIEETLISVLRVTMGGVLS